MNDFASTWPLAGKFHDELELNKGQLYVEAFATAAPGNSRQVTFDDGVEVGTGVGVGIGVDVGVDNEDVIAVTRELKPETLPFAATACT